MRTKILLIALLCLAFAANAQTPRFLKKELKESPDYVQKKDGFVYKWYQYSYLLGEDTVYAAFDINGKRITPNSEWIYSKKHSGAKPRYVGGGIFEVLTNINIKSDTLEWNIVKGYNTKGTIIFPASLKTDFISYSGDGFFVLNYRIIGKYHKDGLLFCTKAVYDSNGKCIIPNSLGYNLILYFPEKKIFVCWYADEDYKTDFYRTYTLDGQYFAEGKFTPYGSYSAKSWYNLTEPDDLALFEKHKFPASAATKNPIDQSQAIAAHKKAAEKPATSSSITSTGNTSYSSNDNVLEFPYYYCWQLKAEKKIFALDSDDKDFFCGRFIIRYEFHDSYFYLKLIAKNIRTGAEWEKQSYTIYPSQSGITFDSKETVIIWIVNGITMNVLQRPENNFVFLYDGKDISNQDIFSADSNITNRIFEYKMWKEDKCSDTGENDYDSKYSQLKSRLSRYSWKQRR
ncbi:MAG: hypothetical protein J6T88_04050 [Bacteroidales bacterium]|nr:hypothetical protein [Bacteroidales bacterium]